MKTLKLILLTALFVSGLSLQSFAQAKTTKVGHINTTTLLEQMPEYKTIQDKYKAKVDELTQTAQLMQTELEKVQKEYIDNEASWSESQKSMKKLQIKDQTGRMEQFQATAQDELEQFIADLQKPLIDKIKKAIDEVAVENGYSHILDTAQGLVLYSAESFDIYSLVAKKLGIVEKKPAAPAAPQK